MKLAVFINYFYSTEVLLLFRNCCYKCFCFRRL